jgi:hypothetical protein
LFSGFLRHFLGHALKSILVASRQLLEDVVYDANTSILAIFLLNSACSFCKEAAQNWMLRKANAMLRKLKENFCVSSETSHAISLP